MQTLDSNAAGCSTLPAADMAQTTAQKRPTILCVDDDPQLTAAIELRLSEYEVDVFCNFTGMQGIWRAISEKPDLIIVDLVMPQGNGEYLIECIRQNNDTASIPVIMLTGAREQRLARRMRKLGVDSFLRKPVHTDELIAEIEKYVDLHQIEYAR